LSDPIGLPLSSHHLSGDGKTNDGLKNGALYQLFFKLVKSFMVNGFD